MLSLELFVNDKYKLLKFLYDNQIQVKEDYYITNFEIEKKRSIPIGDIIVYIFLFSILMGSLYMILFK